MCHVTCQFCGETFSNRRQGFSSSVSDQALDDDTSGSESSSDVDNREMRWNFIRDLTHSEAEYEDNDNNYFYSGVALEPQANLPDSLNEGPKTNTPNELVGVGSAEHSEIPNQHSHVSAPQGEQYAWVLWTQKAGHTFSDPSCSSTTAESLVLEPSASCSQREGEEPDSGERSDVETFVLRESATEFVVSSLADDLSGLLQLDSQSALKSSSPLAHDTSYAFCSAAQYESRIPSELELHQMDRALQIRASTPLTATEKFVTDSVAGVELLDDTVVQDARDMLTRTINLAGAKAIVNEHPFVVNNPFAETLFADERHAAQVGQLSFYAPGWAQSIDSSLALLPSEGVGSVAEYAKRHTPNCTKVLVRDQQQAQNFQRHMPICHNELLGCELRIAIHLSDSEARQVWKGRHGPHSSSTPTIAPIMCQSWRFPALMFIMLVLMGCSLAQIASVRYVPSSFWKEGTSIGPHKGCKVDPLKHCWPNPSGRVETKRASQLPCFNINHYSSNTSSCNNHMQLQAERKVGGEADVPAELELIKETVPTTIRAPMVMLLPLRPHVFAKPCVEHHIAEQQHPPVCYMCIPC